MIGLIGFAFIFFGLLKNNNKALIVGALLFGIGLVNNYIYLDKITDCDSSNALSSEERMFCNLKEGDTVCVALIFGLMIVVGLLGIGQMNKINKTRKMKGLKKQNE